MNKRQTSSDHGPRTLGAPHESLWRTVWAGLRDDLRDRWATLRREPDAGYSTETVLVTALLVAAALVVISIIVAKVTEKAQQINLGLVLGLG